MWPFQAKTEPRQGVDHAHLELSAQIHGLVQRVKQVEDDLAALEAKHERLRGRFYGLRGRQNDEPESKAEILRRMGFLRGAVAPPPAPASPLEENDG